MEPTTATPTLPSGHNYKCYSILSRAHPYILNGAHHCHAQPTQLRGEHADEAGEEGVDIAHHLGAVGGHADADPFVEGPEAGQDQVVREHLQQEGQEVQCCADVGVVGHHVARGGVHLSQGLQELGEPGELDVNVWCVCVCGCV